MTFKEVKYCYFRELIENYSTNKEAAAAADMPESTFPENIKQFSIRNTEY
jgi:hypothetical protein